MRREGSPVTREGSPVRRPGRGCSPVRPGGSRGSRASRSGTAGTAMTSGPCLQPMTASAMTAPTGPSAPEETDTPHQTKRHQTSQHTTRHHITVIRPHDRLNVIRDLTSLDVKFKWHVKNVLKNKKRQKVSKAPYFGDTKKTITTLPSINT